MARSLGPGQDAIYAMHRRWLADVLGPGNSLFTPGSAIWTAELLDELAQTFIGKPDLTSGKDFLDKLRDQLAPVSAGAIQLMAELHAVYFLIIRNGAITATRKRNDLEAITSWMPSPCAVPAYVLTAMDQGIVHPGSWALRPRGLQLKWLIGFSLAWKDLPAGRQGSLIKDPWAMRLFAETIPAPSVPSAPLALLHLAHPDTFEPIMVPGHKRLITDRFADFAGSDLDIDRQILAVRDALTAQYGEGFYWYQEPLVHRWSKNKGKRIPLFNGDPQPPVDHIVAAARGLYIARAVLDEIVELLDDKGQVVLYGPPGTGKTFLALRLARAIAEDEEKRMSLVQFHPATSYEDFFEGLRPHVTDAGAVNFKRTSGPLVAIAEKAAADPDRRYVMVIDEINRANLPKVFGELLFLLEYRNESARTLYRPEEPFRLPANLWFIGTMNTADRSVAVIDAAMRRRFHFVPFFPHAGPMKGLLRRWLDGGRGRRGVADLLDAVNQELLDLVGEHLLVGPSHFMKADLSDRSLERIWTYNVFPLIEEQLWGNREETDRWRWESVRQRFAGDLNGALVSVAVPDVPGSGGDEPDPG